MFELSGVRVIEWFLWESVSEGSTGIQKQFDLLDVRIIGGSSYQECTLISNFMLAIKLLFEKRIKQNSKSW